MEVKHREEKNLAILYKLYPALDPTNNTFDLSSVGGSFIWGPSSEYDLMLRLFAISLF